MLALDELPIFGICGLSGAGKTTLIERLVPLLSTRGLKVAVVKYDAHGIVVDQSGKDSDRFFRSGADVFLNGPQEEFFRTHTSNENDLPYILKTLCRHYDLVLVEGSKSITLTKVWLSSDRKIDTPPDIDGIIATLPRDSDRVGSVISILDDWLPEQWLKPPVLGCVLIGGESTRMGMPKHLIAENGKTWLEKTIELLKCVTQRIVVAGTGNVPEGLSDTVCLPDVYNTGGPMSGILSAMRWAPYASWLVTACDLPGLSLDSLQWLLSTRRPGVWATLPMLRGSGRGEPLLAHYDFRAHVLLEKLAAESIFSPVKIAGNSKVIKVTPPEQLVSAWRNINTKDELNMYRAQLKDNK